MQACIMENMKAGKRLGTIPPPPPSPSTPLPTIFLFDIGNIALEVIS